MKRRKFLGLSLLSILSVNSLASQRFIEQPKNIENSNV